MYWLISVWNSLIWRWPKASYSASIDVAGRQAETCGGLAVDADVGDAAAQLQVVGNVAERRVGAQFFGEALGPGVERRSVVALEYVLVLGAARAGAEVDVLAGAQVQHDARHLRQFRADAVDELAGRHIAITAVFQGDPEAAVGDGLVAAGDADRVREGFYGRVGLDDLGQGLVFGDHVRYDISAAASLVPSTKPVSWTGKNPLGINT